VRAETHRFLTRRFIRVLLVLVLVDGLCLFTPVQAVDAQGNPTFDTIEYVLTNGREGRQLVWRLMTSAARSSGRPAKPPSLGILGSSVPWTKRSALSRESHTDVIRKPPSVGPAAWNV
jgi:hypothetical protein